MADFLMREAELSDNDGDEEEEGLQPKKKKKRPNVPSEDEDEEEEDDDGKIREEMQGFVVEEDEEEEGEPEAAPKSDSESEDEDLDDEDRELIGENLGVKVVKKSRGARILEDEDDEGDDEAVKDKIGHELFDGEDLDDGIDGAASERGVDISREEEANSSDSDGDEGWLVDNDERPVRPRKPKNPSLNHLSNAQLEEAREIFGVDFDFGDLVGDDDEEEPDEDEDLYEEEGYKKPKRKAKESLLEHIEPAEIERGFLSVEDKKIQLEDKPERFQLRRTPVTEAEVEEITEEAKWIIEHAFLAKTVSMPDAEIQDKRDNPMWIERNVSKVHKALDFMRNQTFEVPFIAFYRKEYVEPELTINDLWKVYQWDEKWCQLRQRKAKLKALFERMQRYQYDQIAADPAIQQSDEIRIIEDEEITMIDSVTTMEQLQDISQYFDLYYGDKSHKMQEHEKMKALEEGREDEALEDAGTGLKQAVRKDPYHHCVSSGLGGFAAKFGLSPKQLGENLEEGRNVHEVDPYPVDPEETAQDYVCRQFPSVESVKIGARYMVARQFSREPGIRKYMRNRYERRAMVNVKPTNKGRKEIDENHAIYTKKYIHNKPVCELAKDEYLKLLQAEENGLITITITPDKSSGTMSEKNLFQEVVSFADGLLDEPATANNGPYRKDEFNDVCLKWNELRDETLQMCMEKMLYPMFAKELRSKLYQESREFVLRECCLKLYNWLQIGAYIPPETNEEFDLDLEAGTKVLGIAYPSDRKQASFCALVGGEGQLLDHLRLVNLTKNQRSRNPQEAKMKEQDLAYFRKFVLRRSPHVVALSAENLDAINLKRDLETVLKDMYEQSECERMIPVEIVDNELAKVFAASKAADADFGDLPYCLREAISVARRIQDPLPEFTQMCTPDEEILCINYHPLQTMIPKDDLLEALQLEFINRVNEVGVGINKALEHPHTSGTLQFVCGLGPRKATQILKTLQQNENTLENRTKLVTLCKMGPKVFMNCAGFLKIDSSHFDEHVQAYVETLDGTRVHPETYEWARKMAIDALEIDENDEEQNRSSALEDILKTPEKLKDLDLDAFAEELERQGFGNKKITLYDIRAELNHPYKDLRMPFRPPQGEELFNLLTKETPQTFNVGKLVMCRVMHVVYKRPQENQLNDTNPVRDDASGFWQCPLCMKNDFSELSEVWTHFDSKQCPGQAVGVRVRLENGISGFIPTKYISDKRVDNPNERVQSGMPIYCRVLKVDTDRFQAELSCRTSDLEDKDAQFRPPKDTYFHYAAETSDKTEEQNKKKQAERTKYVKRVIAHNAFQNIDFRDAEAKLAKEDQGECIFRPSSKSANNLTVTWKVCENVYQHVDVREEGKENPFSLGRSLWIEQEEFEDLDEIIARHIHPMAEHARDIINFKYFKYMDSENPKAISEHLASEKEGTPARIPYVLIPSRKFPGKFVLAYMPRKQARNEYVTVTPEGFRFRGLVHSSLAGLLKWFKEHFRDPIPQPRQSVGGATPGHASSYGNAMTPGPSYDAMSRVSATPGQQSSHNGSWAMRPPQVPPMPHGMNMRGYGMPADFDANFSDTASQRSSQRSYNSYSRRGGGSQHGGFEAGRDWS